MMKKETSARNCARNCIVFRRTMTANIVIIFVIMIKVFHASEDVLRKVFHDTRQDDFSQSLSSYAVVTPVRVHADGQHLSHLLSHRLRPEAPGRRKRRSPGVLENETGSGEAVHYKMTVDGTELHLELFPNDRLFAPGLVVERRRRERKRRSAVNATAWHGDARAERITSNRCHFAGKVRGRPESMVALATCDGLHGYIHTGQRDYFIEPIKNYNRSSSVGHPHLIYRRSALPQHQPPHPTNTPKDKKQELCGVTEEHVVTGERQAMDESDSRTSRSGKRRRKRSISLERNVETLVVVDKTMMTYHRNDNIENYVLTIMNMVSTMYHDATIGNAVNVVLVRIIYLEQDERDLVIQTHADHTLASFCKWQNNINQKDDNHPNHHDVAILLTRLDICSRSNEPCSTLGLSQVSGLCQHHRSCSINQDTGLALAFTVAHELGHNFGMQHDTAESGCDPRVASLQYIMAPQLTAEASPLVWSNCSRKAITAFLDRDWGYCLEDEPSEHEFEFPVLPPGVMYDIDHQCRLQYGPEAEYCDGIDDLCTAVWCRVDNKCLTRLEAAAEGTLCGDSEWCFGGRCVAIEDKPLAIDSHWGEWGSWSECTRTCGAGVSQSERLCNNPPPSHGGRYCLGERKRFRICNTEPCPENTASFREQQCSDFNNVSYKGHKYEWEPVASTATPCQLHCKPRGRYFSVMLKDVVTDGTPCRSYPRGMCISGRCRVIGCDWGIESDAVEDGCGICHGDGSTCKKVTTSFDKKSGIGYVEVVVIPEGARNIRVEEVAEANNYLAIRNDRGVYYLNGNWFIQWSGDYNLAGTVVEYRRDGNKESIFTRGPTSEPLHLMLLFQSQNPGVKLEYTVIDENVTERRRPEFHWKYSDWTHCTASCGGGSQTSQVVCVEKEAGIVEDGFCNATTRPDDMHKTCNDHQCPARWWFGPWQHCSVSCGENGFHLRTVLCVRQRGPDEQYALEDWECDGLIKPPEKAHCKEKEPCPVEGSVWKIGPWSEVCRNDPCAVQKRSVECKSDLKSDSESDLESDLGPCDPREMPPVERPCPYALCGHWEVGEWSQCSQTCGGGVQVRDVVCIGGRACSRNSEPDMQQTCNTDACNLLDVQTDSTLRTENISQMDNTSNRVGNDHETIRVNSSTSVASAYVNLSTSVTSGKEITSTELAPRTFLSTVLTAAPPGNNANHRTAESFRWTSLVWSECSKRCGHGYKTRKVLCMKIQTKEIVEDEFCREQNKPAMNNSCRREPCITWTVTAWLPCSASCGEGLQERLVSCALPDLCDPDEKPSRKMICNLGPCIRWTTGTWLECSQSCGNGVQRRDVTCIDSATQRPSTGCDETSKPSNTQNCNVRECPSLTAAVNSHAEQCSRNFLNDRMCAELQSQGRCSLNYVQRKCCKACQRSTSATLVSNEES